MRVRVEHLPISGVVREEQIAFLAGPIPAEPRLEDADRPGRYLAASCGCGWEQPLNARTWLNQGQGWRRLAELSSRLRCMCGARDVGLAIREGDPPAVTGNRVYIWR